MNDIIYIVGTTGSGKTALALLFAAAQPSVIISADSRQLYKGMDIVTGKDHPPDVKIYGIDLVDPSQPASVSVWYDHVTPVIAQAQKRAQQVIVVGGTGLYIRALCQGIPTLHIPINQALRDELASKSLSSLQEILRLESPDKYASFNHSDQNNSRRLIRAIEVARSTNHADLPKLKTFPTPNLNGLYYHDLTTQAQVIKERVIARLRSGAIEETQQLLQSYSPDYPSFTALGYREIIQYLRGQLSRDELIDTWTHAELSYVRRQLTYFRKQPATWYDRGRMSLEEIYEHLSS